MAETRLIANVKVGEKGQIVIPKDMGKLFNIKAEDPLLLLADIERGLTVHKKEGVKGCFGDSPRNIGANFLERKMPR